MSREATSFEGMVTGLELSSGEVWATITTWWDAGALPDEPAPRIPYFNCSLRASQLPGVQIGDKVQVAIYLK